MSEPAFGKWQPMETAPKDGTAFLGFLPQCGGYAADQRVQRCVWSGWGGGVWDCQFEKGGKGPMCWMPLPSSPDPAVWAIAPDQPEHGSEP